MAWDGGHYSGWAISLREIVRGAPRSCRSTKDAKRLMSVLVEHGLVRELVEGAAVDGRKVRLAWQIYNRWPS